VYTYVCMRVCVYSSVRIYMFAVYIYIYMFSFMHACTNICVYIIFCMYVMCVYLVMNASYVASIL